LPAGLELLNANDRIHWSRRHAVGKEIRKAAWVCALAAKVPHIARAFITVEYQPPPGNRRRDADNLFASAKPAIDGLVAAAVLQDDSSAYVAAATLRIGDPYPRGRLVLHIFELTGESDGGDG
jgi:crossover junction endodeoxyribonuclease RusA